MANLSDPNEEAQFLLRFEHEWRAGDRGVAREIAKEYVAARNDELFDALGGLTREELVKLVDGYREVGDLSSVLVIQMWQLAKLEPELGKQHVKGVARLAPLMSSDVIAEAQAILDRARQ